MKTKIKIDVTGFIDGIAFLPDDSLNFSRVEDVILLEVRRQMLEQGIKADLRHESDFRISHENCVDAAAGQANE